MNGWTLVKDAIGTVCLFVGVGAWMFVGYGFGF